MKYLIAFTLSAFLVVIDQWSKLAVFAAFKGEEYPVVKVTSWFNLVKVKNTGISFGLFDKIDNGPMILTAIACAIIVALLAWLWQEKKWDVIIGLSFIIGGAIGNVIDRVRLGYVMDFIDIHVYGYHWPAFNVADSAVFIGVCFLLRDAFLTGNKGK